MNALKEHQGARCKERRLQMNAERSSSPANAKEDIISPVQEKNTTKGSDELLYRCNNCSFKHRSAVVIHVHYKKSHPTISITIDKIKQSIHPPSRTVLPDMSSNHKNLVGKSKEKNADSLMQMASKDKNTTPNEDKSQEKNNSTIQIASKDENTRPNVDVLEEEESGDNKSDKLKCESSTSLSGMHVKGKVSSCDDKHDPYPASIFDVMKYKCDLESKSDQSEAEASKSNLSDHLYSRTETEEENYTPTSPPAIKTCALDLFYCDICNYGNQSVKGVMSHQSSYHGYHSNTKDVLDHTDSMRNQLRASKSEGKDPPFIFDLPPPILMEGEEKLFFCHSCNFRGSPIARVLRHYKRNHNNFSVDKKQISLHTANVLKHSPKSQPKVSRELLFHCHKCSYGSEKLSHLKKHVLKFHSKHWSWQTILKANFKKGNIQAGYHCNICVSCHESTTGLHEHYQTQHPDVKFIPSVKFMKRNLFVGPEGYPQKEKPQTFQNASGNNDEAVTQEESEMDIYPCGACSFKATSVEEVTDHYRSVHPWSVKEDGSVPNVASKKKLSVPKNIKKKKDSVDSSQAPVLPEEPPVESREAGASLVSLQCPYCVSRFHKLRDFKTHCELEHKEPEKEEKVKNQVHVFKCQHCPFVNTSFHHIYMHCQMKHVDLESVTTRLVVHETQLDRLLKIKEDFKLSKLKGYMCKMCSQIHLSQDKLNKHYENNHSKAATKHPAVKNRYLQKTLSNAYKNVFRCQQCSYKATTKIRLNQHVRLIHQSGPVSVNQKHALKCEWCPKFYKSEKCLRNHYKHDHGAEAPMNANSSSTMAEGTVDEKKVVYKCLRCLYVHVSYYGTITHCVKKHKDVQPKADNLETFEVLESNFVHSGTGNGKKGYICRECLQVHQSMTALNTHMEKHESDAVQNDTFSSKNKELSVTIKLPLPEKQIQLTADTSPSLSNHSQLQFPEEDVGNKPKLVYKCPHCPYVNSRPHGTLTHSQMIHPNLGVRLRKLKTHKVCESDFINSAKGKGSKEKGYMCKVCSQIHESVKTLKLHIETHQGQDSQTSHEDMSFEDSGMTPMPILPRLGDHPNILQTRVRPELGYRCALCTYSTMIKKRLAYHYNTRHGKEAFLKYFAEPVQQQELPQSSHVDMPSATAEDKSKRFLYKCPRCPYLNARLHGTLTHCQMKHPGVPVSARGLKLMEVLVSNFAWSVHGKDEEKGYLCNVCSQIHMSLKKLRLHRNNHQVENSVLDETSLLSSSSEISHQPDTSDPGGDPESNPDFKYKCSLCHYSTLMKKGLATHYTTDHGPEAFFKYFASVYSKSEFKQPMYTCDICSYAGRYRDYLAFHYKNKHKLDSFTRRTLLQKYNKRRPDKNFLAELSKKAQFKCIKCPHSFFDSSELLISHYNSFHSLQGKQDFTVIYISQILQETTGLFKCLHCQKSLVGLEKLLKHLDQHRETHRSREPLGTQVAAEATSETHYRDEPPSTAEHDTAEEAGTSLATHQAVDQEENKGESRRKKFPCPLCPQTFSSWLGVRNHGVVHKSMQMLKASSLQKLNFDKYVSFKKETTKPYVCRLCSYRASFANLLKIHILNTHSDLIKQCHQTEEHDDSKEQKTQSFLSENVTESVAGEAQEAPTDAASPQPSPPENTVEEEPSDEPQKDKYSCKQCFRTFMSKKGMLSHERSHKAFQAFKRQVNLPSSRQKDAFDKYVSVKEGMTKPYHCRLCPYQTSVLGLLRCHFLKKHQAVFKRSEVTKKVVSPLKEQEPVGSSDELNCPSEPEEEPRNTATSYKEHPDVQRQLNHFSLITQTKNAVKVNTQGVLADGIFLHCEYCDFNSGHLASIRRHYNNRHGKKLLRCKDCEFFSASRKTLEMHAEMNHSTDRQEPANTKNHRCPFCLYQTTDKNSMIDHIILHREERSVPMEVSRPKLSRYLRGLIFRCHKCTYTTASVENLDSHMSKHSDVKPYKCVLCYFDCSQQSELQKHLCDKHQVLRNHELVAQVGLDQLKSSVPVESPNLGLCSSRGGSVEADDVTDCSSEQVESDMDVSEQENKVLEITETCGRTRNICTETLGSRKLEVELMVENDILRNILQLDQESLVMHNRSVTGEPVKRENKQENCLEKMQQEVTSTFPEFSLEPPSGSVTRIKEEQVFKETDNACEECLETEVLLQRVKKEDECLKLELDSAQKHHKGSDIIQLDTCLLITSVSGGDNHSLFLEKKSFSCDLCGRNLASISELESHTKRHRL